MKRRVASRPSIGPSISVQPSIPSSSEKENIIYSCVVDIPSQIDEKRLYMLRDKYQILDEINPRPAAPGEWCCTSNSPVIGIYKAYLL